jgi:hypothetical protein
VRPSEWIGYYETADHCTAVTLPFDLVGFVGEWAGLRKYMIDGLPEPFTRDEWAYLISFLDPQKLLRTFEETFGRAVESPSSAVTTVLRPRGAIAVWLPNNVSLLGPLALVLLSLTGNPIRLKGGSRAEDLTGAFLAFAREHLTEGLLGSLFEGMVRYEVFAQEDRRHEEMAAEAQVRIVFGSDDAADAIHRLPHPLESLGFSFVDRRSEAWIELEAISEALLTDLLSVFAIYGQAGCTSPRRVVVLEGTGSEVTALRDRLVDLWPRVVKRPPSPHLASTNVMTRQHAAALGWDAVLTCQHGAVLAVGDTKLPEFSGPMGLLLVPASLEEAVASMAPNIQTIGIGSSDPNDPRWLHVAATTGLKRIVSISRMHRFGPVWDGQSYWRQAFEEIEVQLNR